MPAINDENEELVSIEDLAAFYQCSTREVNRKVKSGELEKPIKTNDGWRYKAPEGYDPRVAEQSQTAMSLATVLKESNNTVKMQQEHIGELYGLLTGPFLQFAQQVGQQQKENFEHINSLQNRLLEMVSLREAMLSQAHERDLATLESQQRSARMDAAIDLVKQVAPQIIEGLGASKGINVRKLRAAEQVLSSLPLDAVKAMLAAEGDDAIVPPEAQAAAKVLLEEMEKDAAKAPAPVVNTTGEVKTDSGS